MRVLLDANCLIAAAITQHEYHRATITELSRRRAAGQVMVMAAHALLEAYAVLTRLPPPHRLAPTDAVTVLDRNWSDAETVALTATETWRVVRELAAAGISGGRIYDGCIAASARKGKCDEILTWNIRHFAGLPGPRAVTPDGS